MKMNFWTGKLPLALLFCGLVISTAAWQDHSATQFSPKMDTTPGDKKNRDIDQALEEVERAKIQMEKSLKEINIDKIEKDMRASLEKMQLDSDKMKANLEKAMKDINPDKIRVEIDKSLKDINPDRIKAEVQAALAEIDMNKIKKELNEIRSADLKEIELEMKKIRPEIERSIKEAREDIRKTQSDLKEYKGFIDGLDADGLITKKGEYTIVHKDGELIINGRKQPSKVYNKYKSFLEKHKNLKITRDEDDFDIEND
jgi:hypothetical protein